MGIFGGEKYSKEKLEEAKKEARFTAQDYRKIGSLEGRGLSESGKQRIYNELSADALKAKARVEKLYGKGQVEAAALNEEYGRLLAEAQEAIKAVADFEREKLGMHKEGAEEVDVDADKK